MEKEQLLERFLLVILSEATLEIGMRIQGELDYSIVSLGDIADELLVLMFDGKSYRFSYEYWDDDGLHQSKMVVLNDGDIESIPIGLRNLMSDVLKTGKPKTIELAQIALS